VVASAHGGRHANGRSTWGHSLCINPWGEVVAQQATDAGLVLADLDMAALERWRSQLPALGHRLL
jgi:nitrilase